MSGHVTQYLNNNCGTTGINSIKKERHDPPEKSSQEVIKKGFVRFYQFIGHATQGAHHEGEFPRKFWWSWVETTDRKGDGMLFSSQQKFSPEMR